MSVPRTGESSEQANARLHAEGRRDAFDASWAKYEQEDGYSKTDAYHMALADFPPLEESADLDDVVDSGAVEADGSDESSEPAEVDLSTPDALRDADWVYSNLNADKLGAKGLSRKDAPSQAAWTMLCDFGKNPATRIKFFDRVLEPLLKRARSGETYSDDGRELIALAERKRAEFKAEARREREWPAELEDRLDELCEESEAMKWFVTRGRRLIVEAVA